jgi:hypothetical protein
MRDTMGSGSYPGRVNTDGTYSDEYATTARGLVIAWAW